jgi:hypothetical protein
MMTKPQIEELARLGAQARLQALDEERRSLLALFPELKGSRAGGRGANGPARGAKSAPAPRRPHMSAAARKAQSARMSAYWAARRAEKAAGGDATQSPSGSTGGTRRSSSRGRRKK